MNIWITLTFAVLASAKCPPCGTMKWANCDGFPCQCMLAVSNFTSHRVDCTKLVPKCFLMQAEIHRATEGQKTRTTGGKPVDPADEKYDPECESDGKFKAKQCNNSEECWCVSSAGVRRSDKDNWNLTCGKLVKTYWVSLRLTHKPVSTALDTTTLKADITDAIHKRYKNFSKDLVEDVEYKPTERTIVVDVKMTNQSSDLTGTSDLVSMAYYMEKDVKGQTLFTNEGERFEPTVGGQRLEIEDIKVNYVDEEPPTYRVKPDHVHQSVITFVVILVIVMVLVGVVCWYKKRQR